jgi:hypothetical protein
LNSWYSDIFLNPLINEDVRVDQTLPLNGRRHEVNTLCDNGHPTDLSGGDLLTQD